MKFKAKKLIIFDFDGTLINSVPDLTFAVNETLAHYKLEQLSLETVTTFIGNGAELLVKRAFECSGNNPISDDFLEEALKVYFKAYEGISSNKTFLYEGVVETLAVLKDNGLNLVICTNKPFKFIEPILDKLKIKHFFDCWIGEDSLKEKKPSAMPLLHLANKMNVLVEECVMVGDSKNDILAAKNADMESIGLTYGYNYNENIANYGPTVVADDFLELKKLF